MGNWSTQRRAAFILLAGLTPLAWANNDSSGLHEMAMWLSAVNGGILAASAIAHVPGLLGRRRLQTGVLLLASVPTFPFALLFAFALWHTIVDFGFDDWNRTLSAFAAVVGLWCYHVLLFYLAWQRNRRQRFRAEEPLPSAGPSAQPVGTAYAVRSAVDEAFPVPEGGWAPPSATGEQGHADDDDEDGKNAQRRHGLAQEHPGTDGADHVAE